METSDFVKEYKNGETLPLGYETLWYGEIKKELIFFIDDTRYSYGLARKENIIEESIAKIYSKL